MLIIITRECADKELEGGIIERDQNLKFPIKQKKIANIAIDVAIDCV